MPKLPVLAIAGRAYLFLFQEIGTIFRLSWFVVLSIKVVESFIEVKFPMREGGLATFLSVPVSLMGAAIVAVTLHRVILFGDRHPGDYFHIDLGKVELLFALMPILIGVLYIVSSVILTLIWPLMSAFVSSNNVYVATLVLISPLFYLIFRLFIVAPVIVVERRFNLVRAWELTRGNSWRFLAVLFLTNGIFYGADHAIRRLLEIPENSLALDFSSLATGGTSIYDILSQMLLTALGVAALSYSYKFLSGHEADDNLAHQT